jgi:hypothetical protein
MLFFSVFVTHQSGPATHCPNKSFPSSSSQRPLCALRVPALDSPSFLSPVSLFVTSRCALFFLTTLSQLVPFQSLPHSFRRNGGGTPRSLRFQPTVPLSPSQLFWNQIVTKPGEGAILVLLNNLSFPILAAISVRRTERCRWLWFRRGRNSFGWARDVGSQRQAGQEKQGRKEIRSAGKMEAGARRDR